MREWNLNLCYIFRTLKILMELKEIDLIKLPMQHVVYDLKGALRS